MSLVPIASLGKRYGVSVRGMESMIQIASIIHRTDYWRRGRTVEKLGLRAMERQRVDALRAGRDD